MATKAESCSPRFLGRVWRRSRRVTLYAVLAAAAVFIYLHHVGLPEFAKASILQQLRQQGIELDYGRIALRWYDGIVAESVSLAQVDRPNGPQLLLPEVAFRLDSLALLRLRLVVRSLELRNGRVLVPMSATNQVTDQVVTLDRLSAELQFSPDGAWHLENLSGECLGVRLRLQATLTNAAALRSWRLPFTPQPDQRPLAWEVPLHRFIRLVKQLQFRRQPTLSAAFWGDVARPEALRAAVSLGAAQASTPWGSVGTLRASLQLNEQASDATEGKFRFRVESRDVSTLGSVRVGRLQFETTWTQSPTNPVPDHVELDLALDDIRSAWGSLADLHLVGSGQHRVGDAGLVDVDLRLAGGALAAGLGESGTTDFRLKLVEDLESLLPRSGDWSLAMSSPTFAWGRAERLAFSGRFEPRALHAPSGPDPEVPTVAPWQGFAPWQASLVGDLERVSISNAVIDRVLLEAGWDAPTVRLHRMQADLAGRQLQGEADWDVGSGALTAAASLDFDIHLIEELLPEGARRWLARYQWRSETPPIVGARAWLTLPPMAQWSEPRARSLAGDSLAIQGKLVAADVGYQGISMDGVTFDFALTNQVWRLTDFVATAPEGRFEMSYTEHQRTRDYGFDIDAELDPGAFRSLVPQPQQQAFDFFEFAAPPRARGYVRGRYGYPERTEFGGTLQTGPFEFRGEPIEAMEARLHFTNGWVRATDVRVRSEGTIQAEEVAFDTSEQRLVLTGAHATVPPMRVARAIGDEVVRTLSPYTFDAPPEATVHGWLNVRNTHEVDLRFDLQGGPFHYWRFHLPHIRGSVVWSNDTVRLRDMQADFYDGRVTGALDVDFTAEQGADLQFNSRFEGVDFGPLMADLLSPTNRFSGRVDGTWTLTHANSEDWNSWNGYGRAELKDGYLWDLPLFGFGTRIMDNLRIDAGRSQVKGLTADFTLTNSIIHTDNLELESSAMRLDYRGTFDFEGNVDARVEARLLRSTAVVGPLVSLLFSPLTKMFVYKVTGTLAQPKLEPLYIPKPLLFPLDPVGTVKEMFRPPPKPPSEE